MTHEPKLVPWDRNFGLKIFLLSSNIDVVIIFFWTRHLSMIMDVIVHFGYLCSFCVDVQHRCWTWKYEKVYSKVKQYMPFFSVKGLQLNDLADLQWNFKKSSLIFI